jgi:hypothetical protein
MRARAAFLASCLVLIVGVPAVARGADGGADPVVLTPKTNAGWAVTGGSPFQVRTSADMLAYTGHLELDTVNESSVAGEAAQRGAAA